MSRDYLPNKNADLLAWAQTFSSKIAAMAQTIGLTQTQCTTFAGLLTAFEASMLLASDPQTRTRGAIFGRNDARRPLKDYARELARIINAYPGTTNQQRVDLGLNPRTGGITPSNAPDELPVMKVVSAIGRLFRIKLSGLDSTRRGKPDNCDGATVLSYVGNAPPADISLWKFEGSTSRCDFDLELPPTVPAGSQVWLCAFWFSKRKQSGPACTPISAYLAGGVTGTAQAA